MIFFSKVSLPSKCEPGAVFRPPGRKKKEKRTLILMFVKKNIYFFGHFTFGMESGAVFRRPGPTRTLILTFVK
jgi:hypothetical protein